LVRWKDVFGLDGGAGKYRGACGAGNGKEVIPEVVSFGEKFLFWIVGHCFEVWPSFPHLKHFPWRCSHWKARWLPLQITHLLFPNSKLFCLFEY
jgi:hypothetical protein